MKTAKNNRNAAVKLTAGGKAPSRFAKFVSHFRGVGRHWGQPDLVHLTEDL